MNFVKKSISLFFLQKPISFMLFYCLCSFLIVLIPFCIFCFVKIFFPLIEHTEGPFKNTSSISYKFIVAIILAPIMETFVFQYLVFVSLKNKIKPIFIIIISALLFGLSHYYDFFYILNTIYIGLILALAYYNWNGKRINKFWMVVSIHSLHNLITLVVTNLYLN